MNPRWKSWLVQSLSAPGFEDEELTHRARLLNIILLSFTGITLMGEAALYSFQGIGLSFGTGIIILMGLCSAYIMMKLGRINLASITLVVLLSLTMTVSLFRLGGLRFTGFSFYILIALIAGLLLDVRWQLLVLGSLLLSTIALFYGEVRGSIVYTLADEPLPGVLVANILILMAAAVLIYLYTNQVNQALSHSRQNETELAEINRELHLEITEYRQLEAALRNSEATNRALLEAIPDLIFWVRCDGRTLAFVSAGREIISTVPLEQVAGSTAYDVLPFEVAQERIALIDKACQTGQTQSHEYQLYLNQQLHFEEARIVSLGNGEAIVIVRDITQQKQLAQALQNSERQLRRQNQVLRELTKSEALGSGYLEPVLRELAEIATDTLEVERVNIWLYNENRSAIHCLEHYDRSTSHHTRGAEIEAVSYPTYFKALEEERILAAHQAQTDPRTQELSVAHLQPHRITALLDAPIRLRGQVVGVICHEHVETPRHWSLEEQNFAGSLADFVSLALEARERSRAEAALKAHLEQLEETIQERTRSLQEAQERLIRQEKLAFLGQMAGGVGHELRNPLGVITNAVYFLQMILADRDETVKEYLELIASRTREAEKIVSDLLNLSRNRVADRAEVTLYQLIDEVLARHPAPEKVTVTLDLPPNLPPIFIDIQQIRQVLANLLNNAYQAIPEGGKVTITAQLEADWVKLSLADTGIGIAPETMTKIFEPLFTTKSRGIGLGLAVSRNLVEANGGFIGVESTEGQGSTFTLTFPHKGQIESI